MKDNYKLFPDKRISPFDGMSITAGVWADAHHYHGQMQNAHQYFLHGSGIVTGLEVVASDPADSIVYILPGVAIDTGGRMIVLSEPVAYDLGHNMQGNLRILLVHREVKVQASPDAETNAPSYMKDEYVIIARPDVVDMPHAELARINRNDVKAPILDATDFYNPQPNTIDLRFRESVCPPPTEQVLTGVCYQGEIAERVYAKALIHLAKPLADQTPYQLIVENDIPLDKSILGYRLIYLIWGKGASLNKDERDVLRAFVENGGKLLVELTEPAAGAAAEAKATAFLEPVGIKLEEIDAAHAVYTSPNLFVFAPQGGTTGDAAKVWYSAVGVFCSNAGYGKVWSGLVNQPTFTRSVVRETLEWGVNLVNYLLAH